MCVCNQECPIAAKTAILAACTVFVARLAVHVAGQRLNMQEGKDCTTTIELHRGEQRGCVAGLVRERPVGCKAELSHNTPAQRLPLSLQDE